MRIPVKLNGSKIEQTCLVYRAEISEKYTFQDHVQTNAVIVPGTVLLET